MNSGYKLHKCPKCEVDIMGRPKIKKVPINRERFEKALYRKGLSINKLNKDTIIEVDEKTIRRALKDKEINPAILEKIGERLDVDPDWLKGRDIELLSKFHLNKQTIEYYQNIENFPYNKNKYERNFIDLEKYLKDTLTLQGILFDDFKNLSIEKQHGFQMEMDLVLQMLVRKYFYEKYQGTDNLFLSNKELYDLSVSVLSGDDYCKLFELLVL